MTKDQINIVLTMGFAIFVITAYCIWSYLHEEKRLLTQIDDKLYAAAMAIPYVLADDFHDRVQNMHSISKDEDEKNIRYLSQLNNRLKTKFLYTVVQDRQGDYRISSSSALENEFTSNQEVRYYTAYPDASETLKQTYRQFLTEHPTTSQFTRIYEAAYVPIFSDRWGTYRSVFVPMRSPQGTPYIVGADVDISYVSTLLHQNTVKTIIEFLIFTLVLLPIMYAYIGILNRKTREYQQVHKLYMHQSKLSHTDPLTQISNRLKLDEELGRSFAHYKRHKRPFGLVMIDIDNFKSINDQYGHQMGDVVLKGFADLLGRHSRTTDIIGRWGGEEFMIIYSDTNLEGAYKLAENLRIAVENCRIEGIDNLSASFGVAEPTPDLKLPELLSQVDDALYRAKHLGRNRTVKAEFN